MPSNKITMLLPALVVGLVVGLIIWGFWQTHKHANSRSPLGVRDDIILLGFLILAAFALGIFLTYALLL